MSDSTGIFQHASFTVPNFAEGYCTDDNARALVLALMLQRLGHGSPQLRRQAATYAAFLNHAFDRQERAVPQFHELRPALAGRSRLGRLPGARAVGAWAVRGAGGPGSFQMLAAELFEQALPVAAEFTSPRAWAFTLIGIDEYLRRFSGDRRANQIRESLTAKLMQRYADAATDDWHWFEEVVSYANAKLPHALILSGRCLNDRGMLETGLKTLRWLVKFRPRRPAPSGPSARTDSIRAASERALFDQQPIEAQATVSACIEAYHATGDTFWVAEARRAFEWFLGRNDLGLALYDAGHRRLPRRLAHGSPEPEPRRGIHAGLPAGARGNAGAAKHPRQFQGTCRPCRSSPGKRGCCKRQAMIRRTAADHSCRNASGRR